ncbi:hypothetical protein M378DRAFT_585518 [Amanita muscaria Koide BX008]|uniref:Uncharacterized protein n=1 Tax=Amanita muscaria (strain Koide BX008) TaxID=946122 RepID=A0A0C2WRW0_AMAMK|nr:hypothetical protein M378DRAFT_585518 [Amanita muscaria Koide BX008]
MAVYSNDPLLTSLSSTTFVALLKIQLVFAKNSVTPNQCSRLLNKRCLTNFIERGLVHCVI